MIDLQFIKKSSLNFIIAALYGYASDSIYSYTVKAASQGYFILLIVVDITWNPFSSIHSW